MLRKDCGLLLLLTQFVGSGGHQVDKFLAAPHNHVVDVARNTHVGREALLNCAEHGAFRKPNVIVRHVK